MAVLKMLKRSILLAVTFSVGASAESWTPVVTNSTGKTIIKIDVSPHPASVWVSALPPKTTSNHQDLHTGEKMVLNVAQQADKCLYDLRATFDDRTNSTYSSINFCDNSWIALSLSNDKAVYKAS